MKIKRKRNYHFDDCFQKKKQIKTKTRDRGLNKTIYTEFRRCANHGLRAVHFHIDRRDLDFMTKLGRLNMTTSTLMKK